MKKSYYFICLMLLPFLNTVPRKANPKDLQSGVTVLRGPSILNRYRNQCNSSDPSKGIFMKSQIISLSPVKPFEKLNTDIWGVEGNTQWKGNSSLKHLDLSLKSLLDPPCYNMHRHKRNSSAIIFKRSLFFKAHWNTYFTQLGFLPVDFYVCFLFKTFSKTTDYAPYPLQMIKKHIFIKPSNMNQN